jgi:hypothetical protein
MDFQEAHSKVGARWDPVLNTRYRSLPAGYKTIVVSRVDGPASGDCQQTHAHVPPFGHRQNDVLFDSVAAAPLSPLGAEKDSF